MDHQPSAARPRAGRLGDRYDSAQLWAALGASTALATAAIHLGLVTTASKAAGWLGALFIIGGVVLAAVTVVLAARPSAGTWVVGALVMAGMLVGGVLSRTVGLFGVKLVPWPPDLVIAIILEVAYLVVFTLVAVTGRRKPADS